MHIRWGLCYSLCLVLVCRGRYGLGGGFFTPPITSDRKSTQQTTRHSWRGRTGWERPDVETDVDEGGPRLQAATDRLACVADPHHHQPPPTSKKKKEERRISCRQQLAPPPCDAAKMSPRISIGPEPVLAAHAQSPSAAGSHCPAREGSAPHY